MIERPSKRPAVVVRTIPSVTQEGRTCGLQPEIDAGACVTLIRGLRKDQPACKPLFAEPDFRAAAADTPAAVRKEQERRAVELRNCVCRQETENGKPVPRCPTVPPGENADSLDAGYFDRVYMDTVYKKLDERKRELVCLSWAGSVLQSYKHQGWRWNRALAYGFDGATGLGPLVVDNEPLPPTQAR